MFQIPVGKLSAGYNTMLFEELQNKPFDWSLIDSVWNDISIVICNPELDDCPIIFANDKFLEHSGYSRQEILGRNCRFMQGPETEQDSIRQFRELLSRQRPGVIVITNYAKDGTKFKNRIFMTPVKDRSGSKTLFAAVQNVLA